MVDHHSCDFIMDLFRTISRTKTLTVMATNSGLQAITITKTFITANTGLLKIPSCDYSWVNNHDGNYTPIYHYLETINLLRHTCQHGIQSFSVRLRFPTFFQICDRFLKSFGMDFLERYSFHKHRTNYTKTNCMF